MTADYDGLDRQTTRTQDSTSTGYHYDGTSQDLLAQAKPSDTTVYGYSPNGRPLALDTTTGSPQLLTGDGDNNTAVITNDQGNVVCATRYDPWGNPRTRTGALPAGAEIGTCTDTLTANDLWYRSTRRDSSTGNYQLGSRTYNPGTASFLTADSYRDEQPTANLSIGTDPLTRNTYAYVNGDPVNFIDPFGHEPRPSHEGIRSGRRPRLSWSANDAGSERIQVARRQAARGLLFAKGGPTDWERAIYLFNYETSVNTPPYLKRRQHTHDIPWLGFSGTDPCELMWHGEMTCANVIRTAMHLGANKHDGNAILLDFETQTKQWDQFYSDIGTYMEALAIVATARAAVTSPVRSASARAQTPIAPQVAAGVDDAASIVSRTAQSQSARGVQGLQGHLSPAERAAYAANPSGGSRFLGQAVHRATRDALDEAFPGRFIYRTRGIDFVDTWTGEMIELTTRGQLASHMARPGYRGASYATYSLP